MPIRIFRITPSENLHVRREKKRNMLVYNTQYVEVVAEKNEHRFAPLFFFVVAPNIHLQHQSI